MPVTLKPTPSPSRKPIPTPVGPAGIRAAQRILEAAGYDVGKTDGQVTPAFRDALRTFQKAMGLPVTGALDAKSQQALHTLSQRRATRSEQYLTQGMRGTNVRAIEQRLKRLGYGVGKVDGIYSRSTFEAVRQFKADHAKKLDSTSGGLGIPAQKVLAAEAKRLGGDPGNKGKDANVRALSFNWPSRYRKGGDAGDEALFKKLSAQADVMGLQEFKWAHTKITDNEKDWAFHHPRPNGQETGQVLAWRKDKFKLLEKGTHLLSRRTKIQPNAAGPTFHKEKHVVYAKLRHKETGEVWTVAVVHFVPSKHLGGAAEKLWKLQRDNLAKWMAKQGPRTLVMGDFNGQWSDNIARPLHKVGKIQSARSHGSRAIDWVLRSRDLDKVGGGKALSNGGQSDHRPVKGVVRG
ncbi:MAG: peptidoglycan-binding protein [Myxococcales bacterium]